MSILKDINNAAENKMLEEAFNKQQLDDMRKLVGQYKKMGFSFEKIHDMAGDDLEMLEYSPDDINVMIPEILKMFKRG